MAQLTFEGVVGHGQIRLKDQVELPENTKVYVTVAEGAERALHFPSFRLVHPEQASHFVMDVTEDDPNARI